MHKRLKIVGVMGSGEESHETYAAPLGTALAALPVHLLTGGGRGVMTAVARAFTEVTPRAGHSIGIIPTENSVVKDGYPNPYIEIPIITPLGTHKGADVTYLSRNVINVMTADIIIALPGSGGTLNEVMLSLHHKKPIHLFGAATDFVDFPNNIPQTDTLDIVLAWVRNSLQN